MYAIETRILIVISNRTCWVLGLVGGELHMGSQIGDPDVIYRCVRQRQLIELRYR